MRKSLLVLAMFIALGSAAYGQTSHAVQLTVSDADTSLTKPGTGTIYRANGACPVTGIPASASVLTSTLTVAGSGVYTDSNVTPGSTYCYYATVQLGGQTSADSNTFQGSITIAVPVLTGTVQ